MYPPNKKREALGLWFATYGEFSIAEFTAQLGYPDSGTMSRWIRADPRHDPDRAQYRSKPIAPKLEAIRRVAGGESVSSAARAVGPSRGQVRISANMYAEGGTAALPPKATARRAAGMAKKKTAPGKAPYETPPQIPAELPDDPDELRAIIGRLEFDNAVPREVLAVLKADPAFTPGGLARDEKARAALALQSRYGAVAACAALGLAHSTFYSVIGRLTGPDRDDGLDEAVARLPGGRRGGSRLPLRRRPGGAGPRPARVREEGAQVDGEAGLRGLLRGPQAGIRLLRGRDRPADPQPPAAGRRQEGPPEPRDRPVRRQARRLAGGPEARCRARELVAQDGRPLPGARREADRPRRPRMPLPPGRVEGRLLGLRADEVHVAQGHEPRQRGVRGLLRRLQERGLLREGLVGLDGGGVHGAARGDDEMVVVGPPQGIPRRRAAALRYDRRPPYAAGARRIGRRVQENVRTPSFLKLLPRLRPWLRSSMLFGVNGRDINANGMAQEMKIAENNPGYPS